MSMPPAEDGAVHVSLTPRSAEAALKFWGSLGVVVRVTVMV